MARQEGWGSEGEIREGNLLEKGGVEELTPHVLQQKKKGGLVSARLRHLYGALNCQIYMKRIPNAPWRKSARVSGNCHSLNLPSIH